MFPEEYSDYAKNFGTISFYGTEWMGLNIEGYLNVIEATIHERETSGIPEEYFVLENQCIDNVLITVNEKGNVYSFQNGKIKLLCNNLSEYLDICRRRNIKYQR